MIQVWLPMDGSVVNRGLSPTTFKTETATVSNDGVDGKCYSFTATTGNGIYMYGSSVADFMNAYINHHSWTLCGWVNTTSSISTPLLSLTYGLRLNAGPANSSFISLYNSTRTITCYGVKAVNDGQWHHIAGTYNVDTNEIRMYIDGVLEGTKQYTEGETYASSWSNIIAVGRNPNNSTANNSYFFNGKACDVRIYDNALMPNEIAELYSRTRTRGLQIWMKPTPDYKNIGLNAVNNAVPINMNVGNEFVFNGSSSYLKFASGVPKTTKELSYVARVKFNNVSATQCLYSQRTVVGEGFAVFLISGKIRFDAGGNEWSTTQSIPANTWVHIALTFDGTKKKFYYNGAMVQETTGSTTPNVGHTATIGGSMPSDNGTANANWLNGHISDVRVYDNALTDEDVQRIYDLSLYQELEYIESTGSSYFDTGTKFNAETDECKVIFKGNDTSNNGMVFASSSKPYFWFYYYGTSGIRVYADNGSGQQGIAGISSDLNKHTMEWKNKHYIIDGVDKGTFSKTYADTNTNIWLFSYGGSSYPFKGRMYYCEIIRNGVKIREFHPMKRISDSVAGMYDMINGVFYTSSNVAFTAGPNA